MTTVFRACLPRFYSNTTQSLSIETISNKSNSNVSLNNDEHDQNLHNYSSVIERLDSSMKSKIKHTTNSFESSSKTEQNINEDNRKSLLSSGEQTKVICTKNNNTKKRGPCYSRINEQQKPLLKRLVGTIFGDHGLNNNQNKIEPIKNQRSKQTNRNSKKSPLPLQSTLNKQYEDNEKTLQSLITVLTQIESNISSPESQQSSIDMPNLSIQQEQARNNNRLDDTSSSHSNNIYHQPSQATKHSMNTRSIKRHCPNKKGHSDDEILSCSSINSHGTLTSSPTVQRTIVDNQQQTQIHPTKVNIGTSTQSNHANDPITSEPSWMDIMREDQTTINAWARIRRRLKPNQQKDILRALMIICANLFEVPIENKHI